jgi:hypothetical protein
MSTENSIRAIHPYVDDGLLVFDDESVGLVKEPFVGGADEVLAVLAAGVCGDEWQDGFTILFSDSPFRGYQARMDWLRKEYDGNVYWSEDIGMEGWLCPALLKYFKSAPKRLYIQIKERKRG